MSGGGGIIIICGSGGEPVTDKVITVYDAAVSVAIKIDKSDLYNQAVAGGLAPSKAAERVEKLVRMVEADWDRWAEFIEERLGVPYTRHTPHSQ